MFETLQDRVNIRYLIGAVIVIAGILVLSWRDNPFSVPDSLNFVADVTSGEIDLANGNGPVQIGQSGLPVPRFVSLKSDRVNVRVGPSRNHAISWIFKRQGLPVEIIAEFENWRQIRDSDGAEGWVIQSLLSGRRTALIAPWAQDVAQTFQLRDDPADNASVIALLERNILASLLECKGNWCLIHVQDIEGWLQRDLLWGVGPNESIN